MPFCNSCGAQNPDSAKFCAKCGTSLADASNANLASSAQPVNNPIQPADNLFNANSDKDPTFVQPPRGAPPEVGGQTRFYMAAAGVSSGAKFKRFVFFVVVTVVVGIALFLLIRFSIQKQQANREALQKKVVKTMPIIPGTEMPMNTVDEDAKVDSDEKPSEATIDSKNRTNDSKRAKKTRKTRRRTNKKRR